MSTNDNRTYYLANTVERLMMAVRNRIEAGRPEAQRATATRIATAIVGGTDAADIHRRLIDALGYVETPLPLTREEDPDAEDED